LVWFIWVPLPGLVFLFMISRLAECPGELNDPGGVSPGGL
jgi:hypothetical protein